MTTKIKIESLPESNGDVVLNAINTCEGRINNAVLRPGESRELWITSSTALFLTERHPAIVPEPKDPTCDGGEIIRKCGDQGALWAREFVARFPGVEEDSARAWFQNAIEAAVAVRDERRSDAVDVALATGGDALAVLLDSEPPGPTDEIG